MTETIIKADTHFFDHPGSDRANTLFKGSPVEILETWHHVKSRGQEGYVRAEDLRTTIHPSPESLEQPSNAIIDICQYQGTAIQSDAPIQSDADFIPALKRIDRYAGDLGLTVWVTHSLRFKDYSPRGAVVPPAKRSNHLVGHAIDMNLYKGNRNPWFNSEALRRGNLKNLPSEVLAFIDRIRADEVLRWGGDFIRQDPVHIDDNLYRRAPEMWMRKYEAL